MIVLDLYLTAHGSGASSGKLWAQDLSTKLREISQCPEKAPTYLVLRAYSLLKSPTGAVIEEFIMIFCSNQSIINFTDKHPILLLRPRFKRVFSIVS